MIISPAKKLNAGKKYKDIKTEIRFSNQAKALVNILKKYKAQKLSSLMNISQKLGELNYERYLKWAYPFNSDEAGSALLMFQGDVYLGMQANTFTDEDIDFSQKHLRILSGLYGVLRPLDEILPYRLEMGTKLKVRKAENLYQYWGDKIHNAIKEDLKVQGDNILVNLASNEYFKSVKAKKLKAKIITPSFKEHKEGKYQMVTFFAKKARGMMCHYIVKNKLTDPEDLKGFDYDQYSFNHELSDETNFVFTR